MILFSHPTPAAYKDNYHAVQDVLKTSGFLKFNRGVEVGVRHGYFSKYLLEQNPNLFMTLVDPYLEYYDVSQMIDQLEQDNNKEAAANLLMVFPFRIHWMYLLSKDAVKFIEQQSNDFVFIDAEHTYEACREDMRLWYPKVRRGGLLCGHDYTMAGVNRAVNEFAGQYGYEIKHVGGTADVWFMEVL